MMRLPALLAVPLALTACQAPSEIAVSDGYVRLAAVPRNPAAAYVTLHGGAANATLVSVSSDVAIKAEMHETLAGGGMASMKPLNQLALPAGATIGFAPGGRHIMLFNVNPGIKPGMAVPLTFTFGDGSRIVYKATAIAAGDPAPK